MNKPFRSFISILLCLFLLYSIAAPVFAEEPEETEGTEPAPEILLTISSPDAFIAFAENCRLDSYSQNLVVELEADIDLSGSDFASVPIFSGVFHGNGHAVTGLRIDGDGSVLGLFRYLTESAVVSGLRVEGEVLPQGSRLRVGGIAGSNAGKIENCSFSGSVSGCDSVGGLAGINTLTGIIDGCQVSGSVFGKHFVGGIAGENYGVIRDCTSNAEINTTAQENTVDISDITMDSLTNSESANTVTDIGGIAGTSTGVIRDCTNLGNVGYRQMGYNVGGIAGTQSGYITGCENHGAVSGRKEVGGIAGQLEPVYKLDYSTDTLQILQEQLDEMSALTGQASADAQNGAASVNSQISALNDQVESARQAVSQLIPQPEVPEISLPDPENPELPDVELPQLPDEDSILAAQNALSSAMSAMNGTLSGIAATAQGTAGALSRDLQAISSQVNAMSETIRQAPENLGGSITDISDADTDEDISGKVEDCVNLGAVLADRNAGGIAGAISIENDLDPEEDLQISGDSSLNFEAELRAVIRGCKNRGTVTAGKQNAGGIAGWQSFGLVKNCLNTGALDAEDSEFVGGIAGQSAAYIRNCSAKCEISGKSNVGGIAGSAAIVTDCRSMVRLNGGDEKLGAVIGIAENRREAENPICGNFYLSVGSDPGGIDGISYFGCAEALDLDTFLSLENLPDIFQKMTVSFVIEGQTVKTVTVAPGGMLSARDIPQIPPRSGCSAAWDTPQAPEAQRIYFDTVFTAVYTPLRTVLQSRETGAGGLPMVLLQGLFGDDAQILLSQAGSTPEIEKDQTLLQALKITAPESGEAITCRLLLPEDCDSANLLVQARSGDGPWTQAEYTIDGSYIVFSLSGNVQEIALIQEAPLRWPWIAGGAAGVILLAGAVLLWRRHKKAKTGQPDPAEVPAGHSDAN